MKIFLREAKGVPSHYFTGEGHGRRPLSPGADAQEPSGVWGVERSEGCRGNWGGPLWPWVCGIREACPPITGEPGKWRGGREGIGGGCSSDDGRDNITRSERRAPASSTHDVWKEEI